MTSPSPLPVQAHERRLLFPVSISVLQITLQSSKKHLVCKVLVDGCDAFSFPGTTLQEDAIRDIHALSARETTQLQIQLYSDGKLYVQTEVSLWDVLLSEDETTLPMWKRDSGKERQKGTLRIQMKCYEDHLELYQKGAHSQDHPIFSNLVRLLDALKEMGSINARAQKTSRYCLATFYQFLRLDIAMQKVEESRSKLNRVPSGDPLKESIDPSSLRENAIDDAILQCRRQVDYLKRALQLHRRSPQKHAEFCSIGLEVLEWVAKVSFVACSHVHIYIHATYPTILSLSIVDHRTLLRAHERLIYSRARMVYLSHDNPGSPPEAMDELIDDILRLAVPEAREEGWKKSSYTTIMSCFCGVYADRIFNVINQKIQDSDPAESTERDMLRRLLAHMLQGVDWIPHSILLKAADVIRSGPRQIGEGSYGIVRTGQLMVKDERDLQPVAIKAIKWLSSGTQEDRKKLRRQLYVEIVNCWTLKHPSILPLLGVDLQNGEISLVTPFRKNGDIINVLAELRRGSSMFQYQRPLVTLSHRWVGEIARGLTYLHTENIVHGDLRGNNVFVNDDLSIVIADFGLSVFANGHSNNYASRREGNSQWLSPELLNPDSRTRPTKASDVYSFAMVCIETYTGQTPFQGFKTVGSKDFSEDIRGGQRPPRPNEPSRHQEPMGALMNDDLWSLVQRCWDGDKALRPDAVEIEQYLQGLKYLR